jgi:hypothetical protein
LSRVSQQAISARHQLRTGRQDEAVDGLMQLSPKAWPALRYSPDWDCLRGNPRFQAWLKANPPAESK